MGRLAQSLRRVGVVLVLGVLAPALVASACLKPEMAEGARCDASATCPEGFYCIGHVCTAPPEPLSPCRSDGDCDGYVCDLSAWPDAPGIGFCVQCIVDGHCLHGRCLAGATCGCEADADCDTGLCFDTGGFCTSCKSDAQCPNGGLCEDGACVPNPGENPDGPPQGPQEQGDGR